MGIGSVVAVDSNGDIDYSSVSDSRELHDISDKSSMATDSDNDDRDDSDDNEMSSDDQRILGDVLCETDHNFLNIQD